MDFAEMVKKNRSYRRFDESRKVTMDELTELIELTRFTASGGNKQALRFIPAAGELGEKVFDTLAWAAYFRDWNGPVEGERSTGYIVILQAKDYKMATPADAGIVMQTILLGAVEKGLGGCIIGGSIKRQVLAELLGIDEKYEILAVIALGKPIEEVVIDDIKDNDIKYWRDENGVHHVPKRTMDELIIK